MYPIKYRLSTVRKRRRHGLTPEFPLTQERYVSLFGAEVDRKAEKHSLLKQGERLAKSASKLAKRTKAYRYFRLAKRLAGK